VLFRTRPRDMDDTLAQLVHDEDQVIAASAIHLAAERDMPSLSDDIQYELVHRDPRDAYVMEAARWALAPQRMRGGDPAPAAHAPAANERRGSLEPLPTVDLASRLRRVPLFDYVSVDELLRVAGTGRQVRYEPGRIICPLGRPPDALHCLIEGQVESDAPITAPALVPFEEMLTGTPLRRDVRAATLAVTVSLTQNEFLTILSDNVDIAQGLFKMLLDSRGGAGWSGVMPGRMPEALRRDAGEALQAHEVPLLLQVNPLMSAATTAQLRRVAAIARHVLLIPDVPLMRENDEAAIHIVISGALAVERPVRAPHPPHGPGLPVSDRAVARPGDTVGVYETLADGHAAATVTVVEAGSALRIGHRDLFDLLGDDLELLQSLFGALLRSGTPAFAVELAPLTGVGSLV